MEPRDQEESPAPLSSPPTPYLSHRFRIESVHDEDELDCSLSAHHSDSQTLQDNASIGNLSALSHLANDLISGSQSNVAWLSEPGSALGSSLLLASKSYLDLYEEVSSKKAPAAIEEESDEDIFDNPEYIDTLEGRLPLAEAARMIAKDSTRHESLFSVDHIKANKRDCYKRVWCLGISFLLLFSSSFGIRSSISSLGDDKRLSLLCFGLIFSLTWFGGVCANPIISKIRPKWTLALATSGFIVFPLSMFYMSYYTTLPACIYHGFCIGLLWGTEGVYLINAASTYSLVTAEPLANIVRKFNGVIFSLFLCSNIVGNLMSTLILGDFYTLPGETEAMKSFKRDDRLSGGYNGSHVVDGEDLSSFISSINSTEVPGCGLEYYDKDRGESNGPGVYIGKKYILFGVYTLLPVLAALNIIIFLRKLKVAKRPGSANVFKQLKCVVQTIGQFKGLLLLPVGIYLGLQNTIIIADYNASFVSCSYGIDKIGYVVTATFACSIVSMFIITRLIECIGRTPVILICFVIGLGSPIFLLLFKPEQGPVSALAFIGPCIWGLTDSNILTQINCIVGHVYRKNIVHGITMFSTFIGVGAMIGTFLIAVGVISLTTKIYIAIVLNVIAVGCYLTFEILLKKNMLH